MFNYIRFIVVSALCLVLFACQGVVAEASGKYKLQEPSRDGIGKIYMGREIAQVMGHEGAYWLERPSRELQEHPQLIVSLLDLHPEDVVADIGAGTGYMSARLAKQVSQGKVLAIDVQPEMLELLQLRIKEDNLTNIEPVQGAMDDPHLPTESVDLALMVDAYHEFEFPFEMMTHLREALKPGGRVVLAEYKAENPLVLIKRLHKMSETQVKREMKAVGFTWQKTEASLPQQHLLFLKNLPKVSIASMKCEDK